MEASIEISGLKEMEKALLGMGAAVGAKVLASSLREAAKPIFNDMESNIPVGTVDRIARNRKKEAVEIKAGFLKSRLKIKASTNRKGAVSRKFGAKNVAKVRVGIFRVGYVTQVEYGTSKMSPRSFIRPAIRKSEEATQVFKRQLARKIELARKRLNKK